MPVPQRGNFLVERASSLFLGMVQDVRYLGIEGERLWRSPVSCAKI
jgi:hypothetical protein